MSQLKQIYFAFLRPIRSFPYVCKKKNNHKTKQNKTKKKNNPQNS